MKKMIALCLSAVMLLCFAACSQEQPHDVPQITMGSQIGTTESQENETQEATQDAGEAFAFTFNGVQLIPGNAFDAAALPEASSTFEVPSCALEGTDNVYNYDTFELTAFNDGTGEFIYSIFLIDPNLTTPEGLALGDSLEKAITLYGSDYTQADTAYTYESADTMLVLIVENDSIVSIEYRLVIK